MRSAAQPDPPPETRAQASSGVQTAHEPSYLVKHLLGELPPVTTRVQMMRANQAPQSQADNRARNAQSNVRGLPLGLATPVFGMRLWPCTCGLSTPGAPCTPCRGGAAAVACC